VGAISPHFATVLSKNLSGQPSHPKPEGLMLKYLPLPPGIAAMHMELLKKKVEDIIKHLLPGYSHTYPKPYVSSNIKHGWEIHGNPLFISIYPYSKLAFTPENHENH
jgi:hypothetical protein